MVAGKLQHQGEVIQVIREKCCYLSKMLRHLTSVENSNPALLSLSRPDETSISGQALGYREKTLIREIAAKDVFLQRGGRNFK